MHAASLGIGAPLCPPSSGSKADMQRMDQILFLQSAAGFWKPSPQLEKLMFLNHETVVKVDNQQQQQ
jgi:hypothetical protein